MWTSCVERAQTSQQTVVEVVPMADNKFILLDILLSGGEVEQARGRSLRSSQCRLFYLDLLLSVENEEEPQGSDRSYFNVDCSI